MFCINCGAEIEDNAAVCASCNAKIDEPTPVAPKPQVKTCLVPAILLTVLCCNPLGIIAIIYAAQASSKVVAGDIQKALSLARNAKVWCWITLGTGLALNIYIFFKYQLPEIMQMIENIGR